jgi:DNA-binding beta-propeller fold protein YncE
MSLRRLGQLVAIVLPALLCLSCGQVYRPVVIPCSVGGVPGCPTATPPIPANFHAVFGISANIVDYPGGVLQIDVAGDAIIAETPTSDISAPNLGDNPTHAASFPNNSRVFVASAASALPGGGVDVVSSFTPATQSPVMGAVNTISLPTGSQPVFVNTTQNNAVYVANFGAKSVSAINTSLNVVSNTAAVGVNPVALAETPNGLKLYVANQGDNTVSSLNTADLSSNPVAGFSGQTPVWVVARGDSEKVYVLTEGDGKLITIDTATDTATTPDCSVTPTLCVGAGANYILYDAHLNRLYVTNPVNGTVYVFSDTGGANDTPVLLKAISFAAGSAPCPLLGCMPTSVTALPDGSRFYVASYETYGAGSCLDSTVTGACVVPRLTVFDANSLTPKIAPALTLLTSLPPCTVTPTNSCNTNWPFVTNQFAVPLVTSCNSPVFPALYTPAAPRFRVFTTAAADSSRVYVSMCDAGYIAVIDTTSSNINNSGGGTPPDTVITDLPAAFNGGPPQSNGFPANQNPIFLLTGR